MSWQDGSIPGRAVFMWYLLCSTNEIILFESIGRQPTVINLDTVQKIDVLPWIRAPFEVEVFFSEYTKTTISLSPLEEADKYTVIQTLKELKS